MSFGIVYWKNYPNGKIMETDTMLAKNCLPKEE